MIKINKQGYDKNTNKKIQSYFPPGIFKSSFFIETFHIFPVPESVQNKMHSQRKNNYQPGIVDFGSDGGADEFVGD